MLVFWLEETSAFCSRGQVHAHSKQSPSKRDERRQHQHARTTAKKRALFFLVHSSFCPFVCPFVCSSVTHRRAQAATLYRRDRLDSGVSQGFTETIPVSFRLEVGHIHLSERHLGNAVQRSVGMETRNSYRFLQPLETDGGDLRYTHIPRKHHAVPRQDCSIPQTSISSQHWVRTALGHLHLHQELIIALKSPTSKRFQHIAAFQAQFTASSTQLKTPESATATTRVISVLAPESHRFCVELDAVEEGAELVSRGPGLLSNRTPTRDLNRGSRICGRCATLARRGQSSVGFESRPNTRYARVHTSLVLVAPCASLL